MDDDVEINFENDTSNPSDFGRQHFFRSIQLTLAVIYGILSLSLFCHLFVALSIIVQIRQKIIADNLQHYLYVLSMTIVDAFVLSHLPFLVIEIVETSWTFGLVWCKFFWIAESVNKFLSTLILTALSFDRYLAICVPSQVFGILRSSGASLLIIASCIIAAFGLLSPIYLNVTVANTATEGDTVLKCVIDWSVDAEQKFTFSLFAIGYCAPLILMSYFYSQIVCHVRKNAQIFRNDNANKRARKVTTRSFLLVSFYFMCWTPFWIMSLYISSQQEPNEVIVIIFYFMHALVYLNSAVNPVLYIFSNSEFRNQNKKIICKYSNRLKSLLYCEDVPVHV